ncbi:hypothetical protein AAHC03_026559 [Spirometra sp. Aus1]
MTTEQRATPRKPPSVVSAISSRIGKKANVSPPSSVASQKTSTSRTVTPLPKPPKVKNEITIPKASNKVKLLGDIPLSDEDLDHLAEVCKRYEMLQKQEDDRIRKIREAAVQRERDRSGYITEDTQHCSLCGSYFMFLINPRNECEECQKYICGNCISRAMSKQIVLCKKCYTESKQRAETGLWFMDQLRRAKAEGRIQGVAPVSALRSSLIRKKKENSSASSVVGFPTNSGDERSLSETAREAASRLRNDAESENASVQNGQKLQQADLDSIFGSLSNRASTLPKSKDRVLGQRSNSLDNRSIISSISVTSAMSLYSEPEESFNHGLTIAGDIYFSVDYDTKRGAIRIFMKQARQIAPADAKSATSDTYVKTYLLPDRTKASKRKTSIRKRTLNPVFNEELVYQFPRSDLAYRTLQVSLWHHRTIGANLFLGEVLVPLAEFPFSATPEWYTLQDRQLHTHADGEVPLTKGSLTVSLKYQPRVVSGQVQDLGDLYVNIREAKDLDASSSNSPSGTKSKLNPYAKVYLLPHKTKDSKKKTKAIKKTSNPSWNTSFVYANIEKTQLPSIGIEIAIYDHVRMSTNEFLGGCRINAGMKNGRGMDAFGAERDLWVSMMSKINTIVQSTIPLRATLV